ncbi:phosphate ABC transporter substrate-binding protein [Methyloceanibacter superfactus]|uniref:Phosphate ABC transporter substrate-binding protein n=1 Tax=Methyloceanibacter superfactus TaxID=1774969 RepID=A0A1E3W3T2_9HYPH|nr:PstS family phosphate ABC transporter substrate-binding protein [Methyloceanibacter superfactus]ODS00456.1 phosphate ABC transporter substrate-binding protein [Methyloceanibacter superfactus]
MNRIGIAVSTLAVAALCTGGPALARDQIKIVGSSTVFPYTQAVAEEFGKKTGKKAPVVESTGTGGGMKIFCQGIGEDKPDITGASRAMKKSEFELCTTNGVTDVTELLIGYDGLSIAQSKQGKPMDLSKKQIFLALASEVPDESGEKLVKNPNKKWSDVDKSLPDIEITVYGPPPTSGTRDAFVELAMHEGCEELEYFKKNKDQVKEKCTPMRQDGPFIEAGENDNLIVQRIEADPKALGIFGYSFLYENQDKLRGVKVGGTTPSFETIADGSYGLSRPLFIYIKNPHRKVIPGMDEFIAEYTSDESMGEGGYLHERGLVVLPEDKLKEMQERAKDGEKMAAPTS